MTELPSSWTEVEIASVLATNENGRPFQQGWSPQCESHPAEPGQWAVLKTTAIQHGEFWPHENKALPSDLEPRPQIEVKAGDVLMTCAGPRNRCGVACLVESTPPRLMMSGKMYRFRPHRDALSAKYLAYLIRRRETQLEIDRMKTGINDSGLNLTHDRFAQLRVSLPPLPEQHRIVAKIEELFSELDAGEASLTRARAQLALYRQSLLKAAFQGHLTADWRAANPHKLEAPETLLARIRTERETRYKQALDDWQTALSEWRAGGEKGRKPGKPERTAEIEMSDKNADIPLSWLSVLVEGLLSEPLSNGRSVKDKVGGFPVLRLTAFRNGRLALTESKAGAWTEADAAPWIVKEGDFFAARGNGSKHLVGIGALAVGVGKSVAYPDTMIRLAVDREVVDPEYFAAAWNSRVIRDQIESAARTTAGIYKINQPHICGFAFPLPPREEQERILERIIPVLSQIEYQDAEITTALARIGALRQSILKQAFSGQLVPQDPSDEPASVLLSRLSAAAPMPKTRRKTPA